MLLQKLPKTADVRVYSNQFDAIFTPFCFQTYFGRSLLVSISLTASAIFCFSCNPPKRCCCSKSPDSCPPIFTNGCNCCLPSEPECFKPCFPRCFHHRPQFLWLESTWTFPDVLRHVLQLPLANVTKNTLAHVIAARKNAVHHPNVAQLDPALPQSVAHQKNACRKWKVAAKRYKCGV